uniref:Uncharacterized protein n=1 Tax=Panagrolaimus sp. ES5 TaxID=591445 RepID=A0AC34FPF6_9BILA
MGVGGTQFYTNGQVHVNVQFGELDAALTFFVMPETSAYNPSFNVILGEDSFRKLLPILYNYEEGYIQIGPNTIEIMATKLVTAGQITSENPETVKIEFGPTHATSDQTEQLYEVLNEYIDVISLHEFDCNGIVG